MTILEVAIYLTVLGIIIVPIMMTTTGVTRSTEEGNMLAKILERNRVAFQHVANDFRRSLAGTATITNLGKTLTFTVPGGFDGTGPTTGDVLRFDIQDDPNDPDNGSDDDGDGVADEKILVKINRNSGEQIAIAANLDSTSSGFVANGNGVTITLTTIGWTKGSGVQTTMSRTVTLFPRN